MTTSDNPAFSIIAYLYESSVAGRPDVSIAVICKKINKSRSTVQRNLTQLEISGLIDLNQSSARTLISLTPSGLEIGKELSRILADL